MSTAFYINQILNQVKPTFIAELAPREGGQYFECPPRGGHEQDSLVITHTVSHTERRSDRAMLVKNKKKQKMAL